MVHEPATTGSTIDLQQTCTAVDAQPTKFWVRPDQYGIEFGIGFGWTCGGEQRSSRWFERLLEHSIPSAGECSSASASSTTGDVECESQRGE